MSRGPALTLHNPHSVLAALGTRPQDVKSVTLPYGAHASGKAATGSPGLVGANDAWNRVAQLAQRKGVPIRTARSSSHEQQRGQEARDRGGRTSAASAEVLPRESVPVETLMSGARERAGGVGLWLALDCIQDPHNLGAIFRTAAFFGVQGIMITEERSAPMSATAYDVATGGIEHVPFTLQINLQRGFEKAKEAGLWILGASEHASDSAFNVQRDRPWLLVLGNEEKGMRRLTEEACDLLCSVPPQGPIGSLNVSVAAGVLISHLSPRKAPSAP